VFLGRLVDDHASFPAVVYTVAPQDWISAAVDANASKTLARDVTFFKLQVPLDDVHSIRLSITSLTQCQIAYMPYGGIEQQSISSLSTH